MVLMIAVLPVAGQSTGSMGQDPKSKAKEGDAEEAVAKLVDALRQQKGLPKLHRIHNPHLREDACESAKHGRGRGLISFSPTDVMMPSGVFGDVGNLSTFSYTTPNPNELSPEFQRWATQTVFYSNTPHRFGVGVCFVSTTEHPEGTYWIDVGYYMSAIKTFLYRVTFMWD
jgi:hypothetical protein